MRSEVASENFLANSIQATKFLIWWGLILVPALCPAGHPWQVMETGIRCRKPIPNSWNAQKEVWVKQWWDKKVTARTPKGLMHSFPCNITLFQVLMWLHWSAELAQVSKLKEETGFSYDNIAAMFACIHLVMWWSIQRTTENRGKMGGRGKIVCADATYWTKKKRFRGGFQGRTTAGHTMCFLGLVELDFYTRKETGRAMLSQDCRMDRGLRQGIYQHTRLI